MPSAVLPLSALLSHALVAFTIEIDNEFEHLTPHRTTNYGPSSGAAQGPWLASLVMYSNCMKFVGEEGVSAGELKRLARTATNLNGMERWGYITLGPDRLIRATRKGLRAREIWRRLFSVIETRWEVRFGKDEIDRLRNSLRALIDPFDVELPDCLPILGYGLFSRAAPDPKQPPAAAREEDLTLDALLSRVLLAFAIDFESEADLSLAIGANVVRVLDEQGVRVRDLPALTGVSKESIQMALGFLQKRGFAAVERHPIQSRTKVVRLTTKGQEAQHDYHRLVGLIEERWRTRFGASIVSSVRESAENLVGDPAAGPSPLLLGLKPYPEGWRSSVRKPDTLPHYPMVLHRGGFPDGS